MGGADHGANLASAVHHNLAHWNNPAHSLGGGMAEVEDVNLLDMFSDWM